MLALPTQTLDELISTVRDVIKLNPEHISLYSLILEEGTALFQKVNSGKLELIDEKLERKMYWRTKQILEKAGYKQYEISNFAPKGFESKHNMNCWNQNEYLGFGVAAHSYFNNKTLSEIGRDVCLGILSYYIKCENLTINISMNNDWNNLKKLDVDINDFDTLYKLGDNFNYLLNILDIMKSFKSPFGTYSVNIYINLLSVELK